MATRTKAAAKVTTEMAAAAVSPPQTGDCWLINPSRSGRVYDVAGHSLGGGEKIEVDGCYSALDVVGQTAVDRGYLLLRLIPAPTPPPDPTPPPTP